MHRPARTLPTNIVAQTFRGLMYPVEALGFISGNNLWGLAAVSVVINVVLLALLILLTWYVMAPRLDQLDVWLMGASDTGWIQSLLAAVSWIIMIIAWSMLVGFNAIVLLFIGQAVASPFLEILSEKTEELVLGTKPADFGVKRTIRSISIALSDLVWAVVLLMAVNLPLWFIGVVIPGPGTAIAAVGSFAFTALLLAQEFVTLPMTRKFISYRPRWQGIWNNKWPSFGFGMAAMALMLIPGINLVLLPLAAVGGTLLYCDLEAAGSLGSARS